MIWVSQQFIRAFSSNEQLIMLHLLLHADRRGVVEFSDRRISRLTGIPYQQVRTIHKKLINRKVLDVAANHDGNAKTTHVIICECDSYSILQRESNARANADIDAELQNMKNRIIELENDNNKLRVQLSNVEKKKKEKIKKEKDEKFEECWLAYNRKGSKSKSLECWHKLSDKEKEQVLPHIKVYVSSRDRVYQKDFERYLRDKIFKTIIVKGNDTIYDPEQFTDTKEYRPITDGIFQVWNADRKCLLFNGFVDQLNDGYTSDNRPDGAKIASGLYEWIWSSQTKQWVKQ